MSIKERRIAVLVEDGYQELELWYPVMRLREEGASVVVAAPATDHVYESGLGYPVLANQAIEELDAADFDAVILTGSGAGGRLRRSASAVRLVRDVHEKGGVTAAISSGTGVLLDAGVVVKHRVTGDEDLISDLSEAGAIYENQDVVVDNKLLTARSPDDLPAFFRGLQQLLEDKRD